MGKKKMIIWILLALVIVAAAIISVVLVLDREEKEIEIEDNKLESMLNVERDRSVNSNEVLDRFNENIDNINGAEK